MQDDKHDLTCVNSTSPSSEVVDNRLRRAQVTAYSSSCCDECLADVPAVSSGELVREGGSGESAPLPPLGVDLRWGEADRRLCELSGGRRQKSMVWMNDMSDRQGTEQKSWWSLRRKWLGAPGRVGNIFDSLKQVTSREGTGWLTIDKRHKMGRQREPTPECKPGSLSYNKSHPINPRCRR